MRRESFVRATFPGRIAKTSVSSNAAHKGTRSVIQNYQRNQTLYVRGKPDVLSGLSAVHMTRIRIHQASPINFLHHITSQIWVRELTHNFGMSW